MSGIRKGGAEGGGARSGGPLGIWNRSFALLWQGQLVSSAGDVAYQIALGFWLLEETGSTALMGAVMAAGIATRAILAPLAGVIVDRADRRLLMVLADAAAGASVLLVGAAAVSGALEVWMVLAAGIVVGACGALFAPAVESVLPDIVPGARIVRANASLASVYSGSGVAGNLVGGAVYAAVGAPLLFVANGVSFLLSAASELFIEVPPTRRGGAERPAVLDDVRAGLGLAWRDAGVRHLYLLTCLVNFFGTMAMFLLLPLFQRGEGLGAGWYGALMGCFAAGGLAALVSLSAVEPGPRRRLSVLVAVGLADAACFAALPWMPWVPAMLVLVAISGFATSVENTLLMSAIQVQVPREARGKLFALRGAMVTALVPLAMAVGGALAEHLPVRALISGASAVVLACFAVFPFLPGVRGALGFGSK